MKRIFLILLSVLLVSALISAQATVVKIADETEQISGASSELDLNGNYYAGSEELETMSAEDPIAYAELVHSGNLIWRVSVDRVVCMDAVSQRDIAFAEMIDLLASQQEFGMEDKIQKPEYISLVNGQGEAVFLILAEEISQDQTWVIMLELYNDKQSILVKNVKDLTNKLAGFFKESNQWNEVDLVGNGNTLFIAALDETLTFQFYLFNLIDFSMIEAGEERLATYTATCPWGEDFLQVGRSESNIMEMKFERLRSDGTRVPVAVAEINSDVQEFACACSETDDLVCYILNNVAYRVNVNTNNPAPEAFWVLPEEIAQLRTGVLSDGKYFVLTAMGDVISAEINATHFASEIRVANIAGDGTIGDGVIAFSANYPDYYASITDGGEESDVLDAMLNQSADFDVYVVSLNGNTFRALKNRGYLQSLNESKTLKDTVSHMQDALQEMAYDTEGLVGFPVSVSSACFLLNTEAIQKLTGIAKNQIPTDWTGFLNMISDLSEIGFFNDGQQQYTFYYGGLTREEVRMMIFTSLLTDCLLWADQSPDRNIQQALLPALQAFEKVEWSRLGLPEDSGEDQSWMSLAEENPILSDAMPEILVMDTKKGNEYWPLSMMPGEDALIPAMGTAMIVNPYSQNKEGAILFLETVWNKMESTSQMILDKTIRKPVKNEKFQEEIAYLNELIPEYEFKISISGNAVEKQLLQAELDELKGFILEYEQNATWLITEESIASYQEIEKHFAISDESIWEREDYLTLMMQYLDGVMNADQFVNQLIYLKQMSGLEGE